jgi:hypothetical protein
MKLPPTDLLLTILLNDALAPGLLAAMICGLVWLVLGRRAGGVAAVLGLLCGFGVGVWIDGKKMFEDLFQRHPASSAWLRETLPFWPESLGYRWLFWTTLAALVVGLFLRIPALSVRLGWMIPATTMLTASLLISTTDQALGLWIVLLMAIVIALEWVILEEQVRRQPNGIVPLLVLVFLAGAVVLIYSHCNTYFDLALILAFSLAGITVVGWLGRLEVGSVVPGAAVALCGLLLAGLSGQDFALSNIPSICFFLVALAPLLLAVTLIPALARLPAVTRLTLQTALVLLPLTAAVIVTVLRGELPDPNSM